MIKKICYNFIGDNMIKKVEELLSKNNIQFETQKTFENCRFEDTKQKARFDFYINNSFFKLLN